MDSEPSLMNQAIDNELSPKGHSPQTLSLNGGQIGRVEPSLEAARTIAAGGRK